MPCPYGRGSRHVSRETSALNRGDKQIKCHSCVRGNLRRRPPTSGQLKHPRMAVGSSGRVVIEMNPELKQQLHELLRRRGTNLKEWFVIQASDFVNKNGNQLGLGLDNPDAENEGGQDP